MAKKLKLKVSKFRELHAALLHVLDGPPKAVGQNVTTVPYPLDRQTRWNLRKNLALVRRVMERLDEEITSIRKELSGGGNEINVKNPEMVKKFIERSNVAQQAEEEVSGFLTVSAKALLTNFETEGENQIPGGILDVLEPLIVDDITDDTKTEPSPEAPAKKK